MNSVDTIAEGSVREERGPLSAAAATLKTPAYVEY